MESITGSDVVVVAFGLQTTNYLYFSMFVLSIYDWLISLDYEVKHIWQSEWNISKILFIITRYGTLLDMPMKVAIFAARYGVVDSDACNILLKATTWLTLLGMSVSELILLLRTIAIYSRSKRVAVPLSIAYVVGVVVGITINWYYFHTTLVGAPLNNGLGGCYIEQKNNRIVLQSSLLLLLAFELAVVILTVRRKFSDLHSGTPLLKVVYRDSFGFFLVLFALTLSAVLVHVLGPPHFNWLMIASVRVVHSIICCRILLNLRRVASAGGDLTAARSTGLVFATVPRPETDREETIRLEVYGERSDEEGSLRQADGDSFVGHRS